MTLSTTAPALARDDDRQACEVDKVLLQRACEAGLLTPDEARKILATQKARYESQGRLVRAERILVKNGRLDPERDRALLERWRSETGEARPVDTEAPPANHEAPVEAPVHELDRWIAQAGADPDDYEHEEELADSRGMGGLAVAGIACTWLLLGLPGYFALPALGLPIGFAPAFLAGVVGLFISGGPGRWKPLAHRLSMLATVTSVVLCAGWIAYLTLGAFWAVAEVEELTAGAAEDEAGKETGDSGERPRWGFGGSKSSDTPAPVNHDHRLVVPGIAAFPPPNERFTPVVGWTDHAWVAQLEPRSCPVRKGEVVIAHLPGNRTHDTISIYRVMEIREETSHLIDLSGRIQEHVPNALLIDPSRLHGALEYRLAVHAPVFAFHARRPDGPGRIVPIRGGGLGVARDVDGRVQIQQPKALLPFPLSGDLLRYHAYIEQPPRGRAPVHGLGLCIAKGPHRLWLLDTDHRVHVVSRNRASLAIGMGSPLRRGADVMILADSGVHGFRTARIRECQGGVSYVLDSGRRYFRGIDEVFLGHAEFGIHRPPVEEDPDAGDLADHSGSNDTGRGSGSATRGAVPVRGTAGPRSAGTGRTRSPSRSNGAGTPATGNRPAANGRANDPANDVANGPANDVANGPANDVAADPANDVAADIAGDTAGDTVDPGVVIADPPDPKYVILEEVRRDDRLVWRTALEPDDRDDRWRVLRWRFDTQEQAEAYRINAIQNRGFLECWRCDGAGETRTTVREWSRRVKLVHADQEVEAIPGRRWRCDVCRGRGRFRPSGYAIVRVEWYRSSRQFICYAGQARELEDFYEEVDDLRRRGIRCGFHPAPDWKRGRTDIRVTVEERFETLPEAQLAGRHRIRLGVLAICEVGNVPDPGIILNEGTWTIDPTHEEVWYDKSRRR